MTRNTEFAVTSPGLDPREALNYLLDLIGATDEQKALADREDPYSSKYQGSDTSITMPLGIGLPAWCYVRFDPSGNLLPIDEDDTHDFDLAMSTQEAAKAKDWEIEHLTYRPKAYLSLNFDTAYGYRADNGAGCRDLHAFLVESLAKWVTDKGHSYDWWDESGYGWTRERLYHGESYWGTLGNPELGNPKSKKKAPLDRVSLGWY